MILTYIRQRSITEETAGTLFRMALVFTLALFFTDMVDAQTAGPQAARLIGTIQSEKFTGAVFSDSKGEQTFYRVFDTLPDGSQIVAVRSESISLKGTNGISYDMYIAHDMMTSPATNSAAPVKPDIPAESISPGAIQNTDAVPPRPKARRRDRRSRSSSDEE
jgi:hypothetical protein